MGSEAKASIGYGVLIGTPDNPLLNMEEIDRDPLTQTVYGKGESGPLDLGYVGDMINDIADVVLLVRETVQGGDWTSPTPIDISKLKVPEGANRLLKDFCEKYKIGEGNGVEWSDPQWFLCVNYG